MADDTELAPEYRDLTQVFFGSMTEATVLRSTLAANGYQTFIPDENIKVVDPFVTGANALDVRLVAPKADAEAVTALIEELRADHGADHVAEPSPTTNRVGWLFVMLLMFGIGLLYWIVDRLFL